MTELYLLKALNVETAIERVDSSRKSLQEDIREAAQESTLIADAATVRINVDNTKLAIMGAISQGITIANPLGTPKDGQLLLIRLRSLLTQTIAYGNAFDDTTDVAFPTATTGTSKWDKLLFEYNAISAKYELLAKNFGA